MYFLQRLVLPLDIHVLKQTVLPVQYMYFLQWLVLPMDVSVLRLNPKSLTGDKVDSGIGLPVVNVL
jgi:hypothetical protein